MLPSSFSLCLSALWGSWFVARLQEIAIRVFRTAHELAMHTVAIFSFEDRLSAHRQKVGTLQRRPVPVLTLVRPCRPMKHTKSEKASPPSVPTSLKTTSSALPSSMEWI